MSSNAQSQQVLIEIHPGMYARRPWDFVQDTTVDTCVAANGAVSGNGADMARAAENIARWKTFLPEDRVKAMMNAGWHWST